jgi:hypothetical protein
VFAYQPWSAYYNCNVCVYVSNKLRMCDTVLIKCDYGRFYEELLSKWRMHMYELLRFEVIAVCGSSSLQR